MRGDPTPNRDSEAFFKRKMRTFHQEIGAKRMHELGLGTRNQTSESGARRSQQTAVSSLVFSDSGRLP